MTEILAADRLTKYYGRRLAVDEVSFAVNAGEVLGLLGPNGSGKSTILRMLTGYLQPSSGTVRVGSYDVATQSIEARRSIGYVPEDVPLYSHMWVIEFLRFMGRIKGLTGAGLAGAVDSVCQRLSLGDVRRQAIGRLSRGYRQRVGVAQALLGDPPLLILDEPTNGLDPRQIIEVRELIGTLSADHTIIVTSHILGEMEKVASRAAILLHGRLLAIETLTGAAARTGKAGPVHIRLRLRCKHSDWLLEVLGGIDKTATATVVASNDDIHEVSLALEDAELSETVAATLAGAGIGLLEMRPAEGNLEALFLRLTERAS